MRGWPVALLLMGCFTDVPGGSGAAEGETAATGGGGDLRVFVTSTKVRGDLAAQGDSATATADAICNGSAAGLGGDWVAWLSADGEDAIDRVEGEGPWFLVDETTMVFGDRSALGGNPAVNIDMYPDGQRFDEAVEGIDNGVWTGTGVGGRAISPSCEGWSATSAEGTFGRLIRTDGTWTNDGALSCNVVARLYCFEQ